MEGPPEDLSVDFQENTGVDISWYTFTDVNNNNSNNNDDKTLASSPGTQHCQTHTKKGNHVNLNEQNGTK